MRGRPPGQKGAIGENPVSGFKACKGFDVVRSPDAAAGRVVGGKRTETKMSLLWDNGSYRFRRLRDQNDDFAICLGASPFDAHCRALPRKETLDRWAVGSEGIGSQHGGRAGRDAAWLSMAPSEAPAWLNERGGTLSAATDLIAGMTGQRPLS